MGVIPNPKMPFNFPISCILALIFPILLKYFPKGEGKGSFPKSQINSLWFEPHLRHYEQYATPSASTNLLLIQLGTHPHHPDMAEKLLTGM